MRQMYDPFDDQDGTNWHPANEAAVILTTAQFTIRDIGHLAGICRQMPSEYERRLVAKYAIIEIVALDKSLKALVSLVLSGKTAKPVTKRDADKVSHAHAAYCEQRKRDFDLLLKIRNKIAAHRDHIDLLEMSVLWNAIDLQALDKLVCPVRPLLQSVAELDIYAWIKHDTDQAGRPFVSIQIPLDDFKF